MRFTQHSAQIYGTLCICAFIFSSCSNAKYLSKDEYYYKGTTVEITDTLDLPPTLQNLSTDLRRLSKIEPNKKLFGIYPLKLWLYNIGDTGIDMYVRNRAELDKKFLFFDFEKVINNLNVLEPQSKFRRWLKEKAGEPQSLMDTILVEETKIRMENYLYNRGFFYPEVTYTVEYQEKKRMAIVTYLAEVNTLYRMGKITYEIEEPRLKKIVTEIPDTSYLQPGNPFDVDYIKYERNRITIYLLNNGYYNFEKDFVYFEVDSSSGKDSLDVYVKISNPKGDSLHHRYRINNIYVYPDAQRDFDKSSVDLDTTHYRDDKSDYYFISSHLEYKPGALASNIFINDSSVIIRNDSIIYQPRYYSISNTRQTVGAFSNLGIFKFVTIEHQELDSGAYFRYLDVIIQLEPLPRKQLTTEFNTSLTTDNLLGNFVNVSYAQKNLLRRLDQVRF
ncbi:MAG: hypothetical protein H7X71_05665, partial [Chitinophagales bacterium]|nr:hypothetical protein [Chitinophagales bacterium]